MKVLITGGCGFLGSNLALDALEKNDEVILFDNLYREGSRKNLSWLREQGNINFHYGDIRNINDIETVVKKYEPDVIFHLAGQVAMTTSIENPKMDFEVNVIGTHNLLESVRVYSPNSIVIYSSTNKVYGDLEQYSYKEEETRYTCIEQSSGFSESTQISFHSPYGCSKGAADQYVLDYSRIFDLKTVVFRHSSMYGGRQFASYDQGWVGWFCLKALEAMNECKNKSFTISGNGKQVRDVLHADDMKRLYRSAIENIDLAKGEAFNVGGGIKNSLSLIELFSMLEEICDVNLEYRKIDVRESDQKVFVSDISKAKNILKWEPIVSSNEGVKRMIDWMKPEFLNFK